MRKSVVFVSVLTMMFFLWTSNAVAGNGPVFPVFFGFCGCESGCIEGDTAVLFGARVDSDSDEEVWAENVYLNFIDPPLGPYDLEPPSAIVPPLGEFPDWASFSSGILFGWPSGYYEFECRGQWAVINGADAGVLVNGGGDIDTVIGECTIPSCETQVYIDIRPQSCPNPLNSKSKGVLPVAILGTADFDVTLIALDTVALGRADGVGGTVWMLDKPEPYIEDVGTPDDEFAEVCDCNDEDPDGYSDLVLKFSIPDFLEIADGDLTDGQVVELQVTGELLDGTPFVGGDCVLMRVK